MPGWAPNGTPQAQIADALASGQAPLNGKVLDAGGLPVADAVVRVVPAFPGTSGQPEVVEVRTDAAGRFALKDSPRGLITIEARSGDLRAIRVAVPFQAGIEALDVGTLSLAPPGTLAGKVRGPEKLSLLGTDIQILGTPYVAKADEAGNFSLAGLPAGKYRVRASRPRFIAPLSAEIEVKPGQLTALPDMVLSPDAPVLVSLDRPNGAPGAEIRLSGRNFGGGPGEPFEVVFGTLRAPVVTRVSDTEARVTVPAGAFSGPVSVVRDGIESDPLSFQIVATVSIEPGYAAVRPGQAATVSVRALDTDGLPVAEPVVSWASADLSRTDRAVPLPIGGMVTPPGEGFFEFAARSGNLVAKAIVGVGSSQVSTIIGGPEALDKGDGGPAAAARLVRPMGVATGPDGTIYVSDFIANKQRAIGRDGIVRTVRSGLNGPRAMAITPDGTFYYTESIGNGKYHAVRLSGETVTEIASGSLYGLAQGPGGVVAVAAGDRVLRLDQIAKLGDPAPILADGLTSAICITFDPAGNLYVGETGRVWRYADGVRKPVAGGGSDLAPEAPALQVHLRTITGVAYYQGALYFVDASRQLLRQVTADGKVRTVAGDGWTVQGASAARFNGDGLALGVSFNSPTGLGVHLDGGLLIPEGGSNRVRLWRP